MSLFNKQFYLITLDIYMINEENNEKLYEDFHEQSSVQKKIIRRDNFTYRNIIKIIEKNLFNCKSILDIGCGAGTLALYLANKGYKVDGIEISKKAIVSCKESAEFLNLENVNFSVMNFPKQTPSKKYDLIICSEVIEHLQDDNLALRKIHSLLNKNGKAIITTPSINAPLYRLNLANDFDKRVGHLRRYSLDSLVSCCEKAGFKIISKGKTEGVFRNFLFLNQYVGKSLKIIKYFISDIVTFIDNISLKIFGESDVYVVVKKTL